MAATMVIFCVSAPLQTKRRVRRVAEHGKGRRSSRRAAAADIALAPERGKGEGGGGGRGGGREGI